MSTPGSAEQGSAEQAPGRGRPVVACQRLTKVFKDFWMRDRARAVDSLDLEVYPNEVFGLLGPNGSGKSTTIKLMLGLLKPTSGRVAVFGRPPSDVAIKKRIGYLPEESYLYPFLNARETLDYYGKLFEIDHDTRQKRIDELLDMIGLAGAQYRQVREYSKGMQRRIGIAQALINDPDFLILDEPTTGLDPLGTRQVKDLIIELGRRGKTILLSSHLLADVEDCVDRLVVLYGGVIRAEGTCDSLLVEQSRMSIETEALDDETIAEVDRVIRARTGGAVIRVSKPRQRLEDLFLDIVEKARAEQARTSGAVSGGETAAFLKGQPEEGAAVIDRLLSAPDTAAQPAPAPAAPARATGPDASVIDLLLSPTAQPPTPAAPASDGRAMSGGPDRPGPARGAPPARAEPAPAADVDLALIRSLSEGGPPAGGKA